jgi:PAS domain S-box-containing protein
VTASARILVVEDNPITRRMVRITLEGEGHEVAAAGDAATALARFRERPPDLVVTDFVLPDLDGLGLVEAIRALPGGAGVPVIVVTGLVSQLPDFRGRATGPTEFLGKPLEPSRLAEAVRIRLGGAGSAPSGLAGRRVVLVDGDDAFLRIARARLGRAGVRVRSHRGTTAALRAIGEEPPDLVLANLLLPGAEAYRLCRRLRRIPGAAGVHAVLYSRFPVDAEDAALAREFGVCAVVSRTPDFGEEVTALRSCLDGDHPAPAPSPRPERRRVLRRRLLTRIRGEVDRQESAALRGALQAAALSVLRGIAESLTRPRDLPGVLGDILVHCLDATGLSRGVLYSLEPGGSLRLEAQCGLTVSARDRAASGFGVEGFLRGQREGESPAGFARSPGVPDAARRILEDLEQESMILVPFGQHESARGLLLLASSAPDLADPSWLVFARSLSVQFGQVVAVGRGLERLAVSEERFRSILETTHEGVLLCDAAGVVTYANRRIGEILGRPIEEVAGRTLKEFLGEEDRSRSREIFRRRHAGVIPGDTRMLRRDGSEVRVQVSTSPLHDERGEFAGMVGMVTDMTEVRLLEEQLRQSQKMEAVGLLAGGIAHDFNNLLTVILGYTGLILDTDDLPAHRKEQVRTVESAGMRAAGLVQQLLAFSRRQVLHPERVDLNAVLRETERMLGRIIGEDVALEFRPDPDLPAVLADPGQVVQMVMNLAVNARDAMPGGGTLTLATRSEVLPSARALAAGPLEAGRYAVLEVADTGFGMDEATKSRIFEPFFTTKAPGKGTGLGLATVYGIVRQSGGGIDVETSPGSGTRFRVLLPALEGGAVGPAPAAEAAAAAGGAETILLVEDETAVRAFVREVLESAGYRVLEVADALQAPEAARRHEGPIHLVLSDVVMPGATGPEVVSAVRAVRPGVAAILASGYAQHEALTRALEDATCGFLSKPFTMPRLLGEVRRVLDAPPGPAPPG